MKSATLVTTLTVIVIDLATKNVAALGLIRAGWIEPVRNHDLALGVAGGPAAIEITAATIALFAAVAVLRRGPSGPLASLALGLIGGASLGNLADRVAFGSVRDFIVGPGLIFNLADVALVVGLAAFGVAAIGGRRQPASEPAAVSAA